jgi:hypothetical protein
MGWTAWVRFPVVQGFSLLHGVPNGSGTNPSYLTGTGGSFPGIKRQGCEADHSPPSSADVKKDGALSPYLDTPISLHVIVLN